MSSSTTEKTGSKKAVRRSRAAEIANTFEWLITAIMLAFVFRAFVMEAFRIPTGSMADTLKGAHFRLRCQQCGYPYDYGFMPENHGLPRDTIPRSQVRIPQTRCPSCGYYPPTNSNAPVANGDRILVLKCIYQFFEPKRWDVVVFKNPDKPEENYIKRLIALPEETVVIIDGDIYINGKISRKPPKVQNELWMPVYDNDYQPIRPEEGFFNRHTWMQPFKNIGDSKWQFDKSSPTEFHLDSPTEQIHTLIYDTSVGNEFRATYAYDDVTKYEDMPFCSDLMVRFYAQSKGRQGRIGVELSKYQSHYRAWVDSTGKMVIARVAGGEEEILESELISGPPVNKHTLVRFANVDHQLIFEFGRRRLTHDLGRSPEGAGPIKSDIRPQVKIFGTGELTLSHIAIFRDIHYTEKRGDAVRGRAVLGNPFTLEEDQFFVLGDNSPNSEDCRWWSRPGKGNNGRFYRKGIVPRDYLVGKALFVYWPSGFDFPWPQSLRTFLLRSSQQNRVSRFMYAIVSLKWIPNIGQMRFIHGGSSESE